MSCVFGEDVQFDPGLIELLFSDINALVNVLNNLTNNYSLLVEAAEELSRTPGTGEHTVNLAIDRAENAGTLIDYIIYTLALKIDFTAEVLDFSGIPITVLFELINQIFKEPVVGRNPDNLLPEPDFSNIRKRLRRKNCTDKYTVQKVFKSNNNPKRRERLNKKKKKFTKLKTKFEKKIESYK